MIELNMLCVGAEAELIAINYKVDYEPDGTIGTVSTGGIVFISQKK